MTFGRYLLLALPLAAFTLPATAWADGTAIMDAFKSPGQTAIITTKGGEGVPCYDSVNNLNTAEDAGANHDTFGFNDVTDHHAVFLHAGEHVRVIDNSSDAPGGAVRLRIESGADAGTGCWVAGYTENVVKDIRSP